jgi:putative membrane protein
MEDGKNAKLHAALLITLVPVFLWSYVGHFDLLTWWLEASPAIIGLIVLIAIYRKFKFSSLVSILIWLHIIILLVGAHYTYSRMPVFNWIRDTFELSRNHYDRLGHLAQGFIPAMIAREVLLRQTPLERSGWLFFIIVSVCLAIAASYELLEWAAAVTTREGSKEFLALQGDDWDTQKDMALCLLGSIAALLSLSKLHDRSLAKLI